MSGAILDPYERRIISQIKKEELPQHILLVIADDDLQTDDDIKKLRAITSWCAEMGIMRITMHVSVIDAGEIGRQFCSKLRERLIKMMDGLPAEITIYTGNEKVRMRHDKPGASLEISIGYGGRYELTQAIKKIAQEVESGEMTPDDINEALIESHLIFKSAPDLIIKTGGVRLTDFLIWQSVYSELYFTDVNWSGFRKVDLLRAIRDFQRRQRRFGK
ncbi:MAG: undecaprenyl diphosphate synthase family protein [Methanocellales archaeon]|nr:undecaprenyl diphosphate synthase family protein [Methanocellales archaeon]